MKKNILTFSLLSMLLISGKLHATADELALTQCEEQGHHFGDGSGKDKINSECMDFFKQKAGSFSQVTSSDKLLSIFGHRNMIFLDRVIKGEHKIDVLAGQMTKLGKVQAIALDEAHHEIAVLDENSEVLFFSTIITGNVAPYRILKTKDLYGAKNLIIDSAADQVIVHNPELKQVLFFSRLANIDAPKGHRKLELLKAMDISLAGKVEMSFDANKRELTLTNGKGAPQLIKIP